MSNLSEDWLMDKADVSEQPFRSQAPVVGPLIAWVRSLWNSVATKWYVRPMLAQQNRFNRLLVERLVDHEARLIEQDREQTTLTHDLADVAAQLQQTNRLLQAIDRRLQRLEEMALDSQEEADETP